MSYYSMYSSSSENERWRCDTAVCTNISDKWCTRSIYRLGTSSAESVHHIYGSRCHVILLCIVLVPKIRKGGRQTDRQDETKIIPALNGCEASETHKTRGFRIFRVKNRQSSLPSYWGELGHAGRGGVEKGRKAASNTRALLPAREIRETPTNVHRDKTFVLSGEKTKKACLIEHVRYSLHVVHIQVLVQSYMLYKYTAASPYGTKSVCISTQNITEHHTYVGMWFAGPHPSQTPH